jgi:hypothetical protein
MLAMCSCYTHAMQTMLLLQHLAAAQQCHVYFSTGLGLSGQLFECSQSLQAMCM